MSSDQPPWNIVFVDDNADLRNQVKDLLESEDFDFGEIKVTATESFEEAATLLQERRVDLVILDVFEGEVSNRHSSGISVLEKWKQTGFSPVILYTALPEAVGEYESAFVRLISKADGFKILADGIRTFFSAGIPQMRRSIVEHFDRSFRDYMWEFVARNWHQMEHLSSQPDFIRLLLRRLASQFSRINLDSTISDGGLDQRASTGNESAHPTEYYIKPPVGLDVQLGDIRAIKESERADLFVVLWPSCDLVTRQGKCKVEKALCARLEPLIDTKEYQEWRASPQDNAKRKKLKGLLKNNRDNYQKDRFYFLPGAWDIPPSLVDLQDLEHLEVNMLRESSCIATLASPFAEALGAQFIRYLGRIGTPDLDVDALISGLGSDSEEDEAT